MEVSLHAGKIVGVLYDALLKQYEELVNQLGFLAEYTRNPVMLSEQKAFSDDYRLNQDTFFEELKNLARFPQIKIALLF